MATLWLTGRYHSVSLCFNSNPISISSQSNKVATGIMPKDFEMEVLKPKSNVLLGLHFVLLLYYSRSGHHENLNACTKNDSVWCWKGEVDFSFFVLVLMDSSHIKFTFALLFDYFINRFLKNVYVRVFPANVDQSNFSCAFGPALVVLLTCSQPLKDFVLSRSWYTLVLVMTWSHLRWPCIQHCVPLVYRQERNVEKTQDMPCWQWNWSFRHK